MAEGEQQDVPFEPVEEKPDYIDELTGLAEPTGLLTFSSSSAIITIQDPNMHGMGKAIAVFILFICMFGFLNGLDYASPESGLIRPDEFVYRMTMGAPEESAVFQGTIYDDKGEPLANATIHISWDNGLTWKSNETLSAEELSKQVSVQAGDFTAPRKPELQKEVTKLETGEITGKQYKEC